MISGSYGLPSFLQGILFYVFSLFSYLRIDLTMIEHLCSDSAKYGQRRSHPSARTPFEQNYNITLISLSNQIGRERRKYRSNINKNHMIYPRPKLFVIKPPSPEPPAATYLKSWTSSKTSLLFDLQLDNTETKTLSIQLTQLRENQSRLHTGFENSVHLPLSDRLRASFGFGDGVFDSDGLAWNFCCTELDGSACFLAARALFIIPIGR